MEGESALLVTMKGGRVADLQLRISEPPRFFEALLRGRKYSEAPDISGRICGACSVAHQMNACHAIENAFGVGLEGPLRDLRRLLSCGEWIKSHTSHIYMLQAPDFLGYESSIRMARDHPAQMDRGLRLKKTGNQILSLLGGREIHPVNVRIGGFYKVPARRELASLAESLKWARGAAAETVRWVAEFPFPEFERDYEFVALRNPDEEEYPFNEGRLVSNKGMDIAVREYDTHFVEEQVSHSTALHSTIQARGAYSVGPQARYSLNFDKLSPMAQEAARAANLGPVCRNPFQGIIVRAVETLYACDEALRIIEDFEMPDAPAVDFDSRAGTGYACTEAPGGTIYHRYSLDKTGAILAAKIVSPSAQNQKTIEADLREFITANIDAPRNKLQWQCEQVIRNYGPCVSCATH
jgi:coenzyme F420-reducing hydrogenase alpha subunit